MKYHENHILIIEIENTNYFMLFSLYCKQNYLNFYNLFQASSSLFQLHLNGVSSNCLAHSFVALGAALGLRLDSGGSYALRKMLRTSPPPWRSFGPLFSLFMAFTCSRTGYISKFLLTKHKTSANRSKMLPAILTLLVFVAVVVGVAAALRC